MKNPDSLFNEAKTINCGGKLISLSTPIVMGILNITPDSFYDGGAYKNDKDILNKAEQMILEGASIIDIGAYSTRPNAKDISIVEEQERLIPIIKLIKNTFSDIPISVDTFRSVIAEIAINEGADMINDISGGTMDEHMFDIITKYKVPYVMMHIRGTPATMQINPTYENVIKEVMDFFIEKIAILKSKGVNDIIIDPGFGFGKTLENNYQLLNHLSLFRMLDCPILCGLSRKSMINKVIDIKPDAALNGTTVLNTIALQNGANILRVHDVKEAMEAIKLVHFHQNI